MVGVCGDGGRAVMSWVGKVGLRGVGVGRGVGCGGGEGGDTDTAALCWP